MDVDRIVEVYSRVRRASFRLGIRRASGMGVCWIVEVDSSARRAGCRFEVDEQVACVWRGY